MSIHLHRELDNLRKMILAEGAVVEDVIAKTIRAFRERNEALALEVIGNDAAVDNLEIDVEEECLKILALYQPVAVDLRFIVAVLKMNNDLERMGDIAVSFARRASYLARRDPIDLPPDLFRMAESVQHMIKSSLDALVNSDAKLALEVCRADDEIDEFKREIARGLRARMEAEPHNLRQLLKVLDMPRHLERLADLATNVAEDVIYLVRGEIIRHRRMDEPQEEG
ncbi:phosphate signaling complex protein PhoU [Candidatus Poribacteria bacterium]|nr:phosphate signaling complex protein PhoU [Candidatus Poribacteria bacterium]